VMTPFPDAATSAWWNAVLSCTCAKVLRATCCRLGAWIDHRL
jgi:hypothetical protein